MNEWNAAIYRAYLCLGRRNTKWERCKTVFFHICYVVFISCILVSCATPLPPEIESRDQAAGVLVSTTARPWEDIASSLQPNFQVTGTTALQQVAPVTQEVQLATLNALGVNLSAGALVGPFKNPASGSYAGTTPSSVPTPETSSGIPTGAALPTPSSPNASLAIDPMLQYTAANALFQYVQLLNSDLTSSTFSDSYVPYVVRMKLSVIPYRENLHYDLLARVAFFVPPGCHESDKQSDKTKINKCPQDMPLVVPLLVTDDIQRAASSAAAESARQLAVALEILAPYAQGTASANSIKQQLQSISGQNYDSLLTVGRDNDNTLLVRIGAAYQTEMESKRGRKDDAGATRALVGQNYDISTIVLVPKSYFRTRKAGSDAGLTVMVNTDFIDITSGQKLPRRPPNVTIVEFQSALTESITEVPKWSWYTNVWLNSPLDDQYKDASTMIGYVASRDFDDFLTQLCLWKMGEATPGAKAVDFRITKHLTVSEKAQTEQCVNEESSQEAAQWLWTGLSAITPDSSNISSAIDLPLVSKVKIPSQTVTVFDDGKTGMTAQVRTANRVMGEKLIGTLTLIGKQSKEVPPANTAKASSKPTLKEVSFAIPILSKSSSFDQTTGILTFQFPTAAGSGISGVDIASGSMLSIQTEACDYESQYSDVSNCTHLYADPPTLTGAASEGKELTYSAEYVLAPAGSSQPPGFTLTSGAKQIVESNGAGTVVVYFPKWGAEDSAVLTFDGASVTATNAGTLSNGQVTVKGVGAVTLSLLNLIPGVPVTAQAEGKLGGNSTGKTSLVFNVVPMQTGTHTP